ncbi:hypothetical protein K469DRAFT_750103 [Zopfia rhizophila CBS 207.26]|uniref:Uncharacterized protein n=1 Tax=Zopfia rhizophila CBS 207.26 TaxID=1314779 RepID=A0A6A6E1D1_9PEZI|nr:hypothetical protein K469DRAFT_750103 [Zopfia rhizophila CBS 207.26]
MWYAESLFLQPDLLTRKQTSISNDMAGFCMLGFRGYSKLCEGNRRLSSANFSPANKFARPQLQPSFKSRSPSKPKLPLQDEFLQTGVIPSSSTSNTPPVGTNCSVCCEECKISPDGGVFTGKNQKRHTCPNCRQGLFVADKLTQEQIAHNDEADYPTALVSYSSPPLEFRAPRAIEQLIRTSSDSVQTASLVEGSIGIDELNRQFTEDLNTLNGLVQQAITTEPGRAEVTGIPHRWRDVVRDILDNYHQAGYPINTFISNTLLQQLTVTAALIYELDLARQLQQCQDLEFDEYKGLLDHPDEFHDRFVSPEMVDDTNGNTLRIPWIVSLRIRARGGVVVRIPTVSYSTAWPFEPIFGASQDLRSVQAV